MGGLMPYPEDGTEYDRARDQRPFANGTEGYGWMEAWCARCVYDSWGTAKNYDPPFCPLLTVAIQGRTPAEWLDGDRDERGYYSIQGHYTCVMFRDRNDPGPREPKPRPDPPGQMTLLPREPFEAGRVHLSVPEVAAR